MASQAGFQAKTQATIFPVELPPRIETNFNIWSLLCSDSETRSKRSCRSSNTLRCSVAFFDFGRCIKSSLRFVGFCAVANHIFYCKVRLPHPFVEVPNCSTFSPSCQLLLPSFITFGESTQVNGIWPSFRKNQVNRIFLEARVAWYHMSLRSLSSILRSDVTFEVVWRLPCPRRPPKWLLEATCTWIPRLLISYLRSYDLQGPLE